MKPSHDSKKAAGQPLNAGKTPSGVAPAQSSKPNTARPSPVDARRVERLDAFAARVSAPPPPGVKERRGKRKRLTDLDVPTRQINGNALRFSLRALDVVVVTLIITAAVWTSYIGQNDRGVIAPIAAALLGAFMFTFMLFSLKAHRFAPSETYGAHMKKVATAAAAALGLWLTAALLTRPDTFFPDALAVAGIAATFGLFALHSAYYAYTRNLHKRGALTPNIVMLGATESARRLIEANAKTHELNIIAIFDDRIARAPLNIHGVPVIGTIDDMLGWEKLPYVNRIVVTLPSMAQARKEEFIKQVRLVPNSIAFLVDEFENLNHVRQRLSEIAQVSMRDVTGKPKSGRHTAIKRLTDIALSSAALLIGGPILALIALAIKIDSPGPALFKQKRHGFNNRVFEVYKFRSMKVEMQDLDAKKQVTKNDDRVTKLGRFIRKTSIDEMPQLINVLKGEMSLVGPRPHAVGMRTEGKDSIDLVAEYAHRHRVKPGITGWAQINGSRGALLNQADVARRVQLDVEYIERSNFFFDLMIMIKTLPCLLGDSDTIR
jgi:Undecaprenyl-phosphate glucose phosphotransferase